MAVAARGWINRARGTLTWLPVVAAFGLAAVALGQDLQALLWREAHLVLIPLSLLGWWSARSFARAFDDTPICPIGQLAPGYVAISGRARALHKRPLVSPRSGSDCVWYQHVGHDFSPHESAMPFRIADGSGECLVSPEGAEISYGKQNGEHMIRPGDEIYVIGQLLPVSETPAQFIDRKREAARSAVHSTNAKDFAAATAAPPPADFPEGLIVELPRLPMLVLPNDGSPYLIGRGDPEQSAVWNRLLSALNLSALLLSVSLLPFSHSALFPG